MANSIFTQIINGEIPCYKIYEDEKTFAFLDINPTQPGHTLVIPKNQIEFLWDLSDPDYRALMDTCKKISRHIRDTLEVKYVGVKVIGEEVPHAHVHLIPLNSASDFFELRPEASRPDPDELSKMAQKLRL